MGRLARQAALTADRATFLRAYNRARRSYQGTAADAAAILTLLRQGLAPERVRQAWRAAFGEPIATALAGIRRTVARAAAFLSVEQPEPRRAPGSAPLPRPR